MKSKEMLELITSYCKSNPEKGFWTALRDCLGVKFISIGYETYVKDAVYMEALNEQAEKEINGSSLGK